MKLKILWGVILFNFLVTEQALSLDMSVVNSNAVQSNNARLEQLEQSMKKRMEDLEALLNSKVTTLETTINSNNVAINNRVTSVDNALKSRVSSLESRVAALEARPSTPRCNWGGWKFVFGDQGCEDDIAIYCSNANITRISYVNCGPSLPSYQP